MDNLPRALMWMRMRPTSVRRGGGNISRTIFTSLDAFFSSFVFNVLKKLHMEIIVKVAAEEFMLMLL